MIQRMTGILILLIGLALCRAVGAENALAGLPCVMPQVAVIDKVELIPLTPFAEIIGAAASEDLLTGAVTLTRGAHRITCTPGKKTAGDGTRAIALPMAPVARGEVLYAPLQAVVTALGGSEVLDFDLSRGSARVSFPDGVSRNKG